MRDLRLSEHYVSVQGEGQHVGVLTQFVRFAGCNMRCPGWPCDTEHAINPKIWMKESEKISPGALIMEVANKSGYNVCLTGGEPFLQPLEPLQELVEQIVYEGYTVECFSNGSFLYPRWALDHIDFMMDWKLEGSGEADTKVEDRLLNATRLKPTDGIKFVVVDQDDLDEAKQIHYDLTNIHDVDVEFWVGAAWDRITNQEIIDYVTKYDLPWRLNVQIHKYLWPPDERGV